MQHSKVKIINVPVQADSESRFTPEIAKKFVKSHISPFYVPQGERSLMGLVVRVLGYRTGGPGSIPVLPEKKSSGPGTGPTQPREYN
jgi:hypothetical protein